MSDITNILKERDELRFKKIGVNATGTYTDEGEDGEKQTAKGKEWLYTRYENGEVILQEPASLTDTEHQLRQAWLKAEREKEQATIVGSKKGPLAKGGPMNKTHPFRR